MTPKLARRLRRTSVALLAGALVLAVAAPAGADVPEGWSDPDSVDPVQALLLFGGIPLALFLVITALVLLPGIIRGERLNSGGQASAEQWFGGPRSGTAELPAPEDVDSQAGGARGRW